MAAKVKPLLLSAHNHPFRSLCARLVFFCSSPFELPSHSSHLASFDSSTSAEPLQNSPPFLKDQSVPTGDIPSTPDPGQQYRFTLRRKALAFLCARLFPSPVRAPNAEPRVPRSPRAPHANSAGSAGALGALSRPGDRCRRRALPGTAARAGSPQNPRRALSLPPSAPRSVPVPGLALTPAGRRRLPRPRGPRRPGRS